MNFNISSAESDLFYNASEEAIKMFGIPLLYIKAENVGEVVVLGEYINQEYTNENVYEIFGQLENVSLFEGEDLYSKFGITSQESANVIVSAKTLTELEIVPLPNDLIYWRDAKTLLEVTRVENEVEEGGFYLGGRSAIVYKLITKKYLFDNDTIATGVPEIDEAMANITIADDFKESEIDTAINNILDSDEVSPWDM